MPTSEFYDMNLDYLRKNHEKVYNYLPLQYDCCAKTTEDFRNRVHYSEQSYQEELLDNYRVFLPNNYRDIEGNSVYSEPVDSGNCTMVLQRTPGYVLSFSHWYGQI